MSLRLSHKKNWFRSWIYIRIFKSMHFSLFLIFHQNLVFSQLWPHNSSSILDTALKLWHLIRNLFKIPKIILIKQNFNFRFFPFSTFGPTVRWSRLCALLCRLWRHHNKISFSRNCRQSRCHCNPDFNQAEESSDLRVILQPCDDAVHQDQSEGMISWCDGLLLEWVLMVLRIIYFFRFLFLFPWDNSRDSGILLTNEKLWKND